MQNLDYLYKEPQDSSSDKLIVLLHGYGSNKEDLFSFANHINTKCHIVSLEAPLDLPMGGNAWYSINFSEEQGKWNDLNEGKKALKIIKENIEFWKAKLKANEVLALGFSQGAILSYSLAFSYPELINSVVAMSGYFLEDLSSITKRNKPFSIFASHGIVDNVIPLQWASDSVVKIDSEGNDITFKTYPVGHGVSPENFQDLQLWLKDHLWM